MLPGPIIIYECPYCLNLLSKESFVSGNTFGAEIYSDGKQITPNLPEFPILTICTSCNSFIWLDKLKPFNDYYSEENIERSKKADKMRFLTIYEYFSVLDIELYDSTKDELYIREKILWEFNDRVRNNEPIFTIEKDKKLFEDNNDRLLEILQSKEYYDKNENNLFIAELYRLKGDFESCIHYINLTDDSYDYVKDVFIKECQNKNTLVFKLN